MKAKDLKIGQKFFFPDMTARMTVNGGLTFGSRAKGDPGKPAILMRIDVPKEFWDVSIRYVLLEPDECRGQTTICGPEAEVVLLEDAEGINLDALSVDPADLKKWYETYRDADDSLAATIFPSRSDCQCRKAVVRELAVYAKYKARAMAHRLVDDIDLAICYERWCEDIYRDLPQWARW
jgi:hypothetical protein